MAGGVGVVIMMCGLLVGLAVIRQVYLDAATPVAQSQDAAAAVYDTLVRFLRQAVLTALLTDLLAVIAGYLYGRGRGAVAVRSVAARSTETAGHALARTGLTTGAVGQWLGTHRPLTKGVVIGAGGLTLFLWNYPTPASVALLLLLVVVVLVIRGVPPLRTEPSSTRGEDAADPGTGPARNGQWIGTQQSPYGGDAEFGGAGAEGAADPQGDLSPSRRIARYSAAVRAVTAPAAAAVPSRSPCRPPCNGCPSDRRTGPPGTGPGRPRRWWPRCAGAGRCCCRRRPRRSA